MGAPRLTNGKAPAAFRYRAFMKTNLPIRITPLGDNELISSEVFDISTSGVSLLIPNEEKRELPLVGQGVRVDLTLMDAHRITCIGKIARTQNFDDYRQPQVKLGIEFYDLPLRYKLAIKQAIDLAVSEEKNEIYHPQSLNPAEAALVPPAFNASKSYIAKMTKAFETQLTFWELLKLMTLFTLLAAGVYFLDQYGPDLIPATKAPSWATQIFELKQLEDIKRSTSPQEHR